MSLSPTDSHSAPARPPLSCLSFPTLVVSQARTQPSPRSPSVPLPPIPKAPAGSPIPGYSRCPQNQPRLFWGPILTGLIPGPFAPHRRAVSLVSGGGEGQDSSQELELGGTGRGGPRGFG